MWVLKINYNKIEYMYVDRKIEILPCKKWNNNRRFNKDVI